MNHNHSMRHLHLGCGESLHSRLPNGSALAPLQRRNRRLSKRETRPRP